MNKQTANLLKQHFDTAFSAPDGIKKLRELILTLAMQGRLVEQDPNDPPASELLKEIERDSVSYKDTKAQRQGRKLPQINVDEMPYELPRRWMWVRLGDIAVIERGGSPRPIKSFLTDDQRGLNWIKIGDTDQGGKYITSTKEKIRIEGLSKTRMVYPGDLLLTNSMSFGRPYITQIEGCIHDGWLRISPPELLEKDYLYHLFSSSFIRHMFENAAAGAVVLNLNSEKVRELPIPLPPLPEQLRIVARIDQLMARCEELEKLRNEREEKRLAVHAAAIRQLLDAPDGSTWDFIQQHFNELYSVKENVAELRKAILQLAVMGKLVPQDPNDPPASELLKEIEAEKQRLVKDGKIKMKKPLPPIKQEDVPYSIPDNWRWIRLDDICSTITSGSTPAKNYFNLTKGVPFLKVYNIRNQKVDFYYKPQFIDDEYHRQSQMRSVLYPGDVIMNIVGPPLGKVAIILDDYPEYNCNQAIVLFRPVFGLLNYFIYLYLLAGRFLDDIELIGTAGQDNISITKSRMILLPLPPISEQQRIVARIDQLMALCDTLEQQIDAADVKKGELLDAVMARL